ncbi:HAD hydrolase-like protein [uncultured Kordia sp.]|uniref:HAD family hydrolase n=1 Tax=uncultured Kordia sp. TaxID=507699 RepID=UPI0026303AA0|nr:HAD hydrolase-like protein [uncultured Kordia sp.]
MKKENLLVFDIDGTLLDSENVHQTGFVKAMKAIGVSSVNTNWESYTHLTDSYIAKENYEIVINRGFSNQILTRFEDEFLKEILDASVTEIQGADAFLNKILTETNYGVCFATGSLLKPAILKLNRANIRYDKELLVTSSHYLTREEIVNAAIAKAKTYFGVKKFKRVISLGDGIWDVKTAQNLNLEFIGIGEKNKEKLAAKGAKHHFVNFKEFDINLL